MDARKKDIRTKVDELCPPRVWSCPKCGTKVTTHVPTFPLECRNIKHRREMFVMVATKQKGKK